MATNSEVAKLRVTHVYTLVVRVGEVPPAMLAGLVEDRLNQDAPMVYGVADSDYGIGEGADFGTSANESVKVEVL